MKGAGILENVSIMKYPRPVQQLFDAFERAGRDLYLVGGAVRDYVLGAPLEALDDLDFCTDARPGETAEILKRAGITVYELGAEFGTVGAVLYAQGARPAGSAASAGRASIKHAPHERYPKDCQITTYRSEEYYRRGSRHPQVQFGDTIEQDLGRRDFSINSMALDKNGEIFDPYDGRRDLEAGVLRVVGDPLETLAEDPLRILRIGRFISKLGFAPCESLRQAAAQRAEGILDISAERWLQEMGKLLRGEHVGAALEFLHAIRILAMILPEVDALYEFDGAPTVFREEPRVDGAPDIDDQPADRAANTAPGTVQPGWLWARTIRALEVAPRVDEDADTRLGWALFLQHIGKPQAASSTSPNTARDAAHTVPGGVQTPASPSIEHQKVGPQDIGHRDLATNAAREIATRFRFDNQTTAEVCFLLTHQDDPPAGSGGWSDPELRRFVRQAGATLLPLLNFQRANLLVDQRHDALHQLEQTAQRIDELRAAARLLPQLPSGIGRPLMRQLGLKPSPIIGQIKNWLEDEIIDERIESGRDSDYYINYIRCTAPEFIADSLQTSDDATTQDPSPPGEKRSTE